MKSMFKSFRGKFNVLLALSVLLGASVSHAIFIRGNGGLAIRTEKGWMAHDYLEAQALFPHVEIKLPAKPTMEERLNDYIVHTPWPYNPIRLRQIVSEKMVSIDKCTAADYNDPNVVYTYNETILELNRRGYSAALAAINFYNPNQKVYRLCTTPAFDFLSPEQQTVLIYHETIYIYLEQTSFSPPTPQQVRSLVMETLVRLNHSTSPFAVHLRSKN